MSGHACVRILHTTAKCTRIYSPLCHQYGRSFPSSSWWRLAQTACLSCIHGGRSPRPLAASDFKAQRQLSTRQDMDFQHNRVHIDNILRANEQSVSVPEFDGRGLSAVRKFDSNQLPANTPNEDRYSTAACLQTKGMLFGVFDGHGGWACAQAVSERLLNYVAVAMMSQRSLEGLERCAEQGRPLPPILQWYRHQGDYNCRESSSLYNDHLRVFWQELLDSEEHGDGMSPPDALAYAFKRLDTDISLEAQVPLSSDLMRSTAIQVQ